MVVNKTITPISMTELEGVQGMIVPANDKPDGKGGMAVLILKKDFYEQGLDKPPAYPGGGTVEAVMDLTHPVYSKTAEKEVGGSPATLRMATTCDAILSFNPLEMKPVEALATRQKDSKHSIFDKWKSRNSD